MTTEAERQKRSAEGWEATALLAEQNKADREREAESLRAELEGMVGNRDRLLDDKARLTEHIGVLAGERLRDEAEIKRLQ
jgi:hypothetical protein